MAEDEDGGQQLYWDDDSKRYYKYDAEKDDYFTDDETRAADEAAAQEAAEEAGPESTDAPHNDVAKEPPPPQDSPPVISSPSRTLSSAEQTDSSPDVKASPPEATSETAGPGSGRASKESSPSPDRQHSEVSQATPDGAVPEETKRDGVKASQDAESHEASGKADTPAAEKSTAAPNLPALDTPLQPIQALGSGRVSAGGGARRNGDLTVSSEVLRGGSRLGGSNFLGDSKADGDFSLASRRGSGMSAGLAEAAVAFHELEAKKKEIQDLQEKLAKTQKRVEELSVRLIQAEQGMTDDERVAVLTRERDELSIQVKRLEDELAGFEECLEAAAVEKESALIQAEKNKELASDIRLQYDNLLVDKDLEIAALREELAQQQLELQNSQQLRPEISQLRERILHYDKTFVQLKQLLLKVSSEKNAMEEENQALIEYRRKAEEKIAELEGGAAEDAQLLQTYEAQHGAQKDLIETQERQLATLVRQLQECSTVKVTYQQAFDRLSKVFKEKEAKNRVAMEHLNAEINQLRSKNEHLQSLTAPRWQRVYALKQQSKTPLMRQKLAAKSGPPTRAVAQSSVAPSTRPSDAAQSAESKVAEENSSAVLERSASAGGGDDGGGAGLHSEGREEQTGEGFVSEQQEAAGTQGEEMLEALQVQIATLQAHAAQRQIQISCRDEKLRLLRLALPEDCVTKIEKSSEGVVAMHAAVWQCFLYLQHVHGVYVQPLMADAVSNPKTTTKEQGFILWLFNSIRSVSFLARALSLFLYHLRSSSASPASSSLLPLLEAPDGAAYTVAVAALRHTSKLLSSATACTLSASFPLEPFDDATHAIALLLPPSLAQAISGVAGPPAAVSSASSSWSRAGSAESNSGKRRAPDASAGAAEGGGTASGKEKSTASSGEATAGAREESVEALMSLAPCVVSVLHVMRAVGLLAVAGACAFEVDKSGERGMAAAVVSAQDARTKWIELMEGCSNALQAFPSWLPPIVEGQDGILDSGKAEKGGEKGEKTGLSLVGRGGAAVGTSALAKRGGDGGAGVSSGFGAWLGRRVRIEQGRLEDDTEEEGDGEKRGKKQEAFPSFEEAFLSTRRLLTQLVEAPELKNAKFVPDKGFHVLRTFVGAFDADRRTVASFGLSPVVGAWCSVWDAVPAGIHSWLEEEEKMEKKVEQLMEEEKKLQAQLEELRETIASKESLASKWEHLYSSTRPKAEKYDRLEEELQRVLKEKSDCVHMLDAARRKVDQQNHEAHQLRHDKREIGVRLQELSKRLEALKKVSLNQAAGGGDVEQIQMLRQIIRKQEAELLEARLAGAMKEAVPTKHEQEAVDVLRELARGGTSDSLNSAGSLSRGPSFMQDLRREGSDSGPLSRQRSLARQQSGGSGRMSTGVVHLSSLQQRVIMHQQTLKMQIEEAEADAQDISGPEAGLQMLEEYRRLQNAVLLHAFQVPIWNPSVAPEENRAKLRRYRNEHDSLQLQMLSLTKKIDRFFSRVAEGSHGGFGEHASLSTSRYIRQFTMLADIASPCSFLQSSPWSTGVLPHAAAGVEDPSSASGRAKKGDKCVQDEKEKEKDGGILVKTGSAAPVTALAVRDGFNSRAAFALRTPPVMRLKVAGKPAWMAAGKSGSSPSQGEASGAGESPDGTSALGQKLRGISGTKAEGCAGADHLGSGTGLRSPEVVQKRLIVTEAQLAALYKKIAGL